MILALHILAALGTACLEVPGDRILVRDLAAVVHEFSVLPPDQPLGLAPVPGARRLLTRQELAGLASRNGIQLEAASEICVERKTERLTSERVLTALRRVIGLDGVRLELLDYSKYPAPPGDLEFLRSGLAVPAGTQSIVPVLWRGRLRYAGNRSFPVWARVKISGSGNRVVAAENLPAARPIQASQVRVEPGEYFPYSERALETPDQVVGRLPRRAIRAGSPILASVLATPRQIERGETVSIEVLSGATQLRFQGRAESAGNTGDVISVRNPANGRLFSARVDGEGKAVVHANSQQQSARSVPAVPAVHGGASRGPR